MIIRAATELFHSSGYGLVGMTDIAAQVGITGPALYRHFRSKPELLYQTLNEGIGLFARLVDAGDATLDVLVSDLATHAVSHRALALLWQRERRHLDHAQRTALRAQLRTIVNGLTARLDVYRPDDLTADDRELLAWCALATLASPSYHHVQLADAALAKLLHRMAMDVLATQWSVDGFIPPKATAAAADDSPLSRRRSSRREHLLAVTVDRFARNGFAGVTMEDIGAAAGIRAPSIYNHFSSKSDLLFAAMTRGGEALHSNLTEILDTSSTADVALDRLLVAYADFATKQPAMIHVLISELPYLPEEHRRTARRTQHDYVSEWTRLLTSARTDVDPAEARCRVHAALMIANDVARTPRLARRHDAVAAIAAAGRAALYA